MKRSLLVLALLLLPVIAPAQNTPYNPFTVNLVRMMSRDFFELNSIPYLEPMVVAVNATSNARFYHSAYVPKNDTLYFRFGVHGMMGFVHDDQKWYVPTIPTNSNLLDNRDTVDFVYDAIKDIFRRGLETGNIVPPERSPTVLGFGIDTFFIPVSYLREEVKNHFLYPTLDSAQRAELDKALSGLPLSLNLPPGGNINTILAAIPQLEIGALYGTELLIRFIPPIEIDTTIGDFSFWGVGLKHSISQYFSDPDFDLAAQVVYQNTKLENVVGVTESRLEAKANIWNVNVHASKRFDWFTAFSGLSLDNLSIKADYIYTLPRDLQASLNLITWKDFNNDGINQPEEYVADPDHIWVDKNGDGLRQVDEFDYAPGQGYPGDTNPQVSTVELTQTSVKWTIGGAAQFGPVVMFLDYSIGKFNIFSGGLEVQF